MPRVHLPSPCLGCGTPTTRTRCPACTQPQAPRTDRPSSGVRYPSEYRRNRARLLANNPPCHWCGHPATTADHLIPRAEGGSHHMSNLVPACARCNSSRGGRQQRRG